MKKILFTILVISVLLNNHSLAQNKVSPYNLSAVVDQTTGQVNLQWNHLETDLYFEENFNGSNIVNWICADENWEFGSSTFKADVNGEYRANTAFYLGEYKSYELEVKVRKTSGIGCGTGIFFNADPAQLQESGMWLNGYRLYFCYESGEWNLFSFVGGGATELQPFKFSEDINSNIGEWNVMKIIYSNEGIGIGGGNIEVFINGNRQGSYFDETFESGKIGLIAYDFFNDGDVEFDYFKVSGVKKGYTFGEIDQPKFRNVYSADDEGISCNCKEPQVLSVVEAPRPNFNEPYVYHSDKNISDFTSFQIYRNGENLGSTSDNIFTETLPDFGTFNYEIIAKYSDGNSDPAEATIIYSGNPNHFVPIWSGEPSEPMSIYITGATLNQFGLKPGDEIGLFDGADCVGVGVLSQEITRTSPSKILADGFSKGSASFKYWDPIQSLEYTEVESRVFLGDGDFSENSSAVFKLHSGQVIDPFITVESPNGGEELVFGQEFEITWSSVIVNNVIIQYSLDNGTSWSIITESTDAAPKSYMWMVPAVISNECLLLIANADDLSLFDISDGTFSIVDPPLKVLYPNGGEELEAGTDANIQWSSEGISTIAIEYSTNNGTNWINISTGVDASTAEYLWNVPATLSDECLIKINEEGGINEDQSDDLFKIVDATSVNNNSDLPNEFKLFQNYPNPFNPSTTIRYQIPIQGFVTLIIYDLLGKEITSLVDDHQNYGNYSLIWNYENKTSGVYLLQLKVYDNFSLLYQEVVKMVYLK